MEPSGAPWRVLETSEPEAPARPEARGISWLVVGAALLAAALGAGGLLLATRSDPVVEVDGGTAGTDGAPASGVAPGGKGSPGVAGMLVVEVGGAVARPGVYRLPAGSRVTDAIAAAGGFGARVDAGLADRQLNLAAALRDGDEIHVPARGELGTTSGASGGGASGGGGTAQGPIDLNSATPEQLDTLPGVGPVTAAKIVAARQEHPFSSVDDLGTRKVLGAATLDKIRALVTVGP